MNDFLSEELINEFAAVGMKVVGVSTTPTTNTAGSSGLTMFYFEGDPKKLENQFKELMTKSVEVMTADKNLTPYEQRLIRETRKQFMENSEKVNSPIPFSGGDNLSENERRQLSKLISELSAPGVTYNGDIPEGELTTLSVKTRIDPKILAQANTNAKG